MTIFYLLRHGEHAVQGRIAAGRTPGIGLSERGRTEAAWAAERLANANIAAIYASPLERAQETVAPLAETGPDPVVDPAVISMGAFHDLERRRPGCQVHVPSPQM